ncbi:MAG: Gfo/Idh/MocA family oxidoreductase [Gammaproteobacteria bacterium]|nr:Gfo/Idh/MocA family oxidoreductase [Gammaproteobacteria bacterium]
MPETHQIAIVGARRARQGTGAYLAAAFARLGQDIRGIVGTSDGSVAEAERALRQDYHIRTTGYTSLAALLDEQTVDILVIASPHDTHLEYLRQGVAAGCHVFCEKPLWFPPLAEMPDSADGIADAVSRILAVAAVADLHIGVNLQWPFTLAHYRQLHPLPDDAAQIQSFDMRLSPASRGRAMVLDSAPHLVSMLHALLGQGDIENHELRWQNGEQTRADIAFDYRHRAGATRVRLELAQSKQQPRPAGYSINGNAVERRVSMKDYVQSLAGGGGEVTMPDLLTESAKHFLEQAGNRAPGDEGGIVHGLRLLHRLVSAG